MNSTNKDKEQAQHTYTRREALRIMTLGVAGIAIGGNLLQSCKPAGAKVAAPVDFTFTPAPDGSKIASRQWAGLGENIGLLGLGCMRLPQQKGGGPWGAPLDQEAINEMVDYSLKHGVNYFDTAPAYGESEKAMGIALSRYPREEYLLATKMSNFARGPQTPTLEDASAMFERSCTNLQTDYFDFFLCHALGSYKEFETRFITNGVLGYLQELKNAGRIKHLGFSFHGSVSDLEKLLDSGYSWDFVQIQMNYLDWKGDQNAEGQYNLLVQRGIPVAVMEPIRGGALANVSDGIKAMLAERHPELSPAGNALSFTASFPGVMVTLSGMSNMDQLVENVATFTDFKPFNEEDNEYLMKVARLYNENQHIPCTGCAYCMPCPNGVNIPANFALVNSLSDALSLPDPDGPHDAEFKRKSKEFKKRYAKELADGTRADACIQCGACLSKCPQHLKIVDYLTSITKIASSI